MQVPFVDLKAQYESLKPEIDQAISSVIHNCDFILGSEVDRFETEFAKYLGAAAVISVGNGLDALRLSLQAIGVQAGDEVIVPANTYIASALAVSAVGARPVLVDAEPETCNIDPNRIADAITPRTRAILPVHLFGQPCDLDPVMEIAERKGLLVLEDACQSHGARYKGRCSGTFGDAGCFSFYPSKNLGCFGDGGAIVTNNLQIAESLKLLRNYGQVQKYYHRNQGVNSRLDNLQAAVLNVKLPHLDRWNRNRHEHALRYNELLATIAEVQTPKMAANRDHIFHVYAVRASKRDLLQKFLADRGIRAQIHYPLPIHLQEAYAELGYGEGSFPVAEKAAKEMPSLPMYSELTDHQIEYVSSSIAQFYAMEQK